MAIDCNVEDFLPPFRHGHGYLSPSDASLEKPVHKGLLLEGTWHLFLPDYQRLLLLLFDVFKDTN